jgi:hypothetical protein
MMLSSWVPPVLRTAQRYYSARAHYKRRFNDGFTAATTASQSSQSFEVQHYTTTTYNFKLTAHWLPLSSLSPESPSKRLLSPNTGGGTTVMVHDKYNDNDYYQDFWDVPDITSITHHRQIPTQHFPVNGLVPIATFTNAAPPPNVTYRSNSLGSPHQANIPALLCWWLTYQSTFGLPHQDPLVQIQTPSQHTWCLDHRN